MRSVQYDHRGNGRSGRPPLDTLAFDRFCSDADALRERSCFEKGALLGLPHGGLIALEYALHYPWQLEESRDFLEKRRACRAGGGRVAEDGPAKEAVWGLAGEGESR